MAGPWERSSALTAQLSFAAFAAVMPKQRQRERGARPGASARIGRRIEMRLTWRELYTGAGRGRQPRTFREAGILHSPRSDKIWPTCPNACAQGQTLT